MEPGLSARSLRRIIGWPHKLGSRLETANNGYVEAQIAINNITNERDTGGILDEFNQIYTPGAPCSVQFTLSVGF
jgi:hypothetical protein